MKLIDLKEILEATGLPVAYSHFQESDTTPLPGLPFICYLTRFSPNFSADDQTFYPVSHVQVELYTHKKDETAEAILENLLNENHLPFTTTESFIESENFYQKIYEMRLL